MKYMFFLLLPMFLFGQGTVDVQNTAEQRYVQITLDSTTTTVIYLLYKEANSGGGNFYLSTTAPTAILRQPTKGRAITSGAIALHVVTDSLTALESDSLYGYVQSYNWDKNKVTYYSAVNDTGFFDFDTPGSYTATAIDYLSWTHGNMYVVDLGGNRMPSTGLKITFGQVTTDNAGAETRLSVGLHILR